MIVNLHRHYIQFLTTQSVWGKLFYQTSPSLLPGISLADCFADFFTDKISKYLSPAILLLHPHTHPLLQLKLPIFLLSSLLLNLKLINCPNKQRDSDPMPTWLLKEYASCLCLLDLSATFNIIDHNILITRLSSWFGIHGSFLNWFKCYVLFMSKVIKTSLLSIFFSFFFKQIYTADNIVIQHCVMMEQLD